MKRSVHFGMNQVSGAAYGGWQGFLSGCWHDAEDMAGVFGGLGYDAKGFFDEQCTLECARREITDAANTLAPGDTFLFSDSGHGGQGQGLLSGTTETLCLFDGQLDDSELRSLLSLFKVGVNVAVICDSCHSGGLDRAMKRIRVAPLFVTRNLPVLRLAPASVQANVVLLAACQRDETAGDGDDNGAFTGSFLEAMAPGQTWQSWMDATARLMSRNFPEQHPQLVSLNGPLAGQLV